MEGYILSILSVDNETCRYCKKIKKCMLAFTHEEHLLHCNDCKSFTYKSLLTIHKRFVKMIFNSIITYKKDDIVNHLNQKVKYRLLKKIGKTIGKCEHCKQSGTKYRCGGCHLIRYCNESCSRNDWHNHKEVCWKIQNLKFFYS